MKCYLLLFFWVLLTACSKPVEGPFVQAIYPTSSVLPENLLRVYIQFSKPMKTTGNIEKIKLTDELGNEVKNVFFNNARELWNKEQTQLTLILDPARVKTGLKVNETFGYAIAQNKSYTLIIEGLEDACHKKMQTSFQKEITIEKADVTIPKTKNWELTIPEVGSKNNFEVDFPQMLDYNSLLKRLIITDCENNLIEGVVSIKNQETKWSFQPKHCWESGNYILHINTRLEDPSGNNLNGLFDHAIGSLRYEKEGVVEQVPFHIKTRKHEI